jgi:hypothetical protein
MTQSDIIRMAKQAGLRRHQENLMSNPPQIRFFYEGNEEYIVRFANLVAAAEREACAKLCDAECNPTPNEGHITTYQSGGYIMAEYLASAIRARGQE